MDRMMGWKGAGVTRSMYSVSLSFPISSRLSLRRAPAAWKAVMSSDAVGAEGCLVSLSDVGA